MGGAGSTARTGSSQPATVSFSGTRRPFAAHPDPGRRPPDRPGSHQPGNLPVAPLPGRSPATRQSSRSPRRRRHRRRRRTQAPPSRFRARGRRKTSTMAARVWPTTTQTPSIPAACIGRPAWTSKRSAKGGYDVGWTSPGEWLAYSVNVKAAGQLPDRGARRLAERRAARSTWSSAASTSPAPLTIPATGWLADMGRPSRRP